MIYDFTERGNARRRMYEDRMIDQAMQQAEKDVVSKMAKAIRRGNNPLSEMPKF
jgi:hypothetical protein